MLGSAEIGHASLIQHGPAARRRRYTRAFGVAALVVIALFGLAGGPDWPPFAAAVSLLLLPLAALLARDRYRSLGHAVVDDRLITRVGSLVRRRSRPGRPRRHRAHDAAIGVPAPQRTDHPDGHHRGGRAALPVPDVPDDTAVDLADALLPESVPS